MGNINAANPEYFRSFAKEIAGKFRRLNTLLDHNGTSGDYHEEILRELLRTFLPRRFSVKKGFLLRGQNEVSRQIDVMIVDENIASAYIYQEGNFAIVLPHAVTAVMEIKSSFDGGKFDAAIENVASAKRLREEPANLTAIVFAFNSVDPTDANLQTWFRRPEVAAFRGQETLAPEGMFFFNNNTLLVRTENGRVRADGAEYRSLSTAGAPEESQAFQLSVILAMLMNACIRSPNEPAARQSLVQSADGLLGAESYRFGAQ